MDPSKENSNTLIPNEKRYVGEEFLDLQLFYKNNVNDKQNEFRASFSCSSAIFYQKTFYYLGTYWEGMAHYKGA